MLTSDNHLITCVVRRGHGSKYCISADDETEDSLRFAANKCSTIDGATSVFDGPMGNELQTTTREVSD